VRILSTTLSCSRREDARRDERGKQLPRL
jgi:hypothetical protein